MTDDNFERKCVRAMMKFFGADRRRIGHALKVLRYAKEIHTFEGGDPEVVFAAAILHDVGIPASEEKYGAIDGRYQEELGPPVAREILQKLGADHGLIEHVCNIVADHHSAKFMDTTEFRVLWDADWLVNIPNWYRDADRNKLEKVIGKAFKTGRGTAMARKMFQKE